jgi:hypothetical protein
VNLVKVGVLTGAVVAPIDHANPGDLKINFTLTATNTGNVTLVITIS